MLFGIALVIYGASIFAQTTAANSPRDRAIAAIERVAESIEARQLALFSDRLSEAAAAAQQVSDSAEHARLLAVLQTYDDLRDVWTYSVSNPIGAFFNDNTSNGLLTRLTDRYPEFRAFVAPFTVRTSDGSLLYPTGETRQFLAQVAIARLAKIPEAVAPPAPIPVTPTAQPPPTPAVTAPPVEVCPPAVEIQAVTPSAHGLLIRSSAPITGSIVAGRQTGEELPSAVPILTIDLPNAMLVGVPARAEWPTGPIESMRATRYRRPDGCGIRLRLQPRVAGNWQLVPTAGGVSVTLERLAVTAEAVAPPSVRPGLASITASGTATEQSRADRPSTSAGFIAVAFAQALPSETTVRGFVSQITPHPASGGAPFGAIGVNSMKIGDLTFNAAIGDLFVTIGDTGGGDLGSITSSLFRGAGLELRPSDALALQLFGGRAASPLLVRLGAEGTFRPSARDRIAGTQASWIPDEFPYAAAAGVVHTSAPGGGPTTLNLFQAAEYRRSSVLRIRLLVEESRAIDADLNGLGYTIESRVLTRAFTVDGYFRALSRNFRPVGGAGFYAALRRSYGVAATYRHRRLSAGAGLSQAKVFSVLDPESVGSFTTSKDINVAYSMSRRFSLQGSYGESSIRTDPGATIPAHSRSRQSGAGIAVGLGEFNAQAQFVRSVTHNEIDPRLDFTSRRIDLDLRSGYWRDIYGRFSLGHSERRDGSRAGSDYRAAVGGPLVDVGRLSISGEAGLSVLPAGVAQNAFRQTYATLRVNPKRAGWLSGGLQLTYERVKIGQERFDAFSTSLSTQNTFRWGEGLLLVPELETRAMRLGERRIRGPTTAAIHIIVFEDHNQNSARDPGETPLTPVFVEIAGRRYQTDANGETRAQLQPGKYLVRLLPRGAAIGFFVPAVSVELPVASGETAEAVFALRPAGRLEGRIEPQGDLASSELGGLVVHVSGAVERQSLTDASGAFDFGLLPVGEYQVEIVPEPLRERNLVAVAPTQVTVRLTRAKRESVTLHVRRATARERFGKNP